MKKVKSKFHKKLIISICFFGVAVASYICYSFLGNNPITDTTKDTDTKNVEISGFSGTNDDFIIDSENNLYFTNYDEKEENTAVYKLKPDSLTVIKLINTPVVKLSEYQITNFDIQLDKNNNLYIKQDNIYNKQWFKVEHDTTNAVELNITGIDNNSIYNIWFDNNNLFFHCNNSFYKLEHDTKNPIEITGFTAPISRVGRIQFDSENNLWIEIMNSRSENKKIYVIKNNTTNAVEIKLNGITDYTNVLWTIDNSNNLYFSKYNTADKVYDVLCRSNINTINTVLPIEIWNSKVGLKNNFFKNKDNTYFFDKQDNLYQINSTSTIATLITGFKGNINNFIIDSENNLYLYNFKSVYVIKNNTTNAVEIIDVIAVTDIVMKNNNIYFSSQEKIYQIKPNTFIATEIEIPKYNSTIKHFYFDNSNKLIIIMFNNKIYKLDLKLT